MQPYLAKEYFGERTEVIILFDKARHNPYVKNVFSGKFTLVKGDKFRILLNLPKERFLIYLTERLAIRLCRYIIGFLRGQFLTEESFPLDLTETRLCRYPLTKFFYDNLEKKQGMNIPIKFQNDLDYKKIKNLANEYNIVAFYFRKKGNIDNLGDHHRSGNSIDEYQQIFEFFESQGCAVLVYGDIDKHESIEFIQRYSKVFVSTNFGIPLSKWNLMVPILAPYVIGNAGGGIIPAALTKTRILIIDGFGYWYGVPNALHTFKLLEDNLGRRFSPIDFMESDPWGPRRQLELKPVSLPSALIREVLLEFWSLRNQDLITYSSIRNLVLHQENWLGWTQSGKISNKYLEYVQELPLYK